MRGMFDTLRKWWGVVPEPREMSAVFTVIYTVALLTGFATLIMPPVSLAAQIGTAAMQSVGGLLIVGSVVGMCGGWYTNAKLERLGILLQAWALLIYGAIVAMLHAQGPGSRLTQLGVIVLALLGSYVVRLLQLWRSGRKPEELRG